VVVVLELENISCYCCCGISDAEAGSAVTIIVVMIFIAIFQNYHIVFLSGYFLCVRNDIFALYLRYASMIEFTASLLKFQHASITCRGRQRGCRMADGRHTDSKFQDSHITGKTRRLKTAR